MKKNQIIKVLKANKKISDYEITISDRDSRELFYVLDHLEINRAVKTQAITIRVYVSDKKTTASSLVVVTSADDEKSLAKKLNKAVIQARSAKNSYYPLVSKDKNINDVSAEKADLNEIAMKVAEAVLKADTYEEGWINSTEIFVSRYQKEFINSKGVDHKSHDFKIEVECIPTWSNGKEEFELYKFYESNHINYKKITEEIIEILELAKARSMAKKIRSVKLPKDLKILVKNDMLETIVDNFCGDLSYRNVYMKQNHYQKNDVLSENSFSLTMKAEVKGCTASKKYDRHGVVLKERKLISGGKVKDSYGDIQFGYYLKEKDITGELPVAEIRAKGSDYENEKHLIIESFSSPQIDEDSGYWGGEVRLARYYDGEKYIPLAGFSIAGNIYEDIKKVEFSKEQCTMTHYKGPKYMIFKGIKIS
ncbi:MAG: hypothetical protein IJI66_01280 [Erysipelotrichaceae bacterium]|nr:hypothetical protein [Erysipelotrichaceae bacterium]